MKRQTEQNHCWQPAKEGILLPVSVDPSYSLVISAVCSKNLNKIAFSPLGIVRIVLI